MKTAVVIVALFAVSVAPAPAQVAWRDTYQSRVEILALLETLNEELLAGTSATRTLESWCGEHRMAAEPKIVAVRVDVARKEPSAEVLQRLAVHDASEVKFRHVQLRCGAHVMSEADPSSDQSTVFCDGNGGFKVQIGDFGFTDAQLKCFGDCLVIHETQHQIDFMAASAGRICRGQKYGAWPVYTSDTEETFFESRADQVELWCYERLLQRSDCKCKDLIQERMFYVRNDRRLHGQKLSD